MAKHHNVRMSVVLSGDVDPAIVANWGERLKTLCEGYAQKDIFSETGRALPTRSLVIKGDETKVGKKSKDRITVLLACLEKNLLHL